MPIRAAVLGVAAAFAFPAAPSETARPDSAAAVQALRALYAAESGGLFWFDGSTPRPALAGCVDALGRSAAIGLRPEDYDATRLAEKWGELKSGAAWSTAELAQFDVGLSTAVMRLLRHVRVGRVDPRSVGFDFDVSAKELELPAVVRSARDGGGCAAAVDAAEPPFVFYKRLVKTLADYRSYAARGEPPPVPAFPPGRKKIEPGTAWAGVTPLDARLRLLGDLPAGAPPLGVAPDGTPLYAGEIVDAVKRYQDRHALDPDGVIGAGTLDAINTPLATRVRQIELAIERVRWVPATPNEPAIVVNVPLFRLWALEPDKPTSFFRMRVVTGKAGDGNEKA